MRTGLKPRSSSGGSVSEHPLSAALPVNWWLISSSVSDWLLTRKWKWSIWAFYRAAAAFRCCRKTQPPPITWVLQLILSVRGKHGELLVSVGTWRHHVVRPVLALSGEEETWAQTDPTCFDMKMKSVFWHFVSLVITDLKTSGQTGPEPLRQFCHLDGPVVHWCLYLIRPVVKWHKDTNRKWIRTESVSPVQVFSLSSTMKKNLFRTRRSGWRVEL